MRGHWALDPAISFLNHGSFGACPRDVVACQRRWQDLLEREPVQFFLHTYARALDEARQKAAAFVGSAAENFVFVPNATYGVNAVLGSLSINAGDELLTTDHVYGACLNALHAVAERRGATVVQAELPLPFTDSTEIVNAVLQRVTARTRFALLDHVTSATGIVLPIQELVTALSARGVDVMVDGAHAPGMLEPGIDELGAGYYTGNFHKWVCAPKGAAFLTVRPDLQHTIRSLVVSHGRTASRGRSRFWEEFDWPGTSDPSAWLSVPDAIETVGKLLPGGWNEVRRRNRQLALQARALLCEALQIFAPVPEAFLGSLVALPLPISEAEFPHVNRQPAPENHSAFEVSPLQRALFNEHRLEVPVFDWPTPGRRWIRISAHLYNTLGEYEQLAQALLAELRNGL